MLKNAAVDRLIEKEQALGSNIKFEDILPEVAGVYPRIMQEGEMDAGAWSCGMVAGLIHDIPTVKELIDRTMAEAHAIIGERLAKFARAAWLYRTLASMILDEVRSTPGNGDDLDRRSRVDGTPCRHRRRWREKSSFSPAVL